MDGAHGDADGGGAAPSGPRSAEPASTSTVVAIAGAVTLADAAVVSWAFRGERAGTPWLIAAMGALYAVVATLALVRLHRRGELRAVLRPVAGDLAFGAILAGVLYLTAMAAHLAITGRGTPREGWIVRVYLLLGDPREATRWMVSVAVFVVAVLEEIAWRGLVQRVLSESMGPIRAIGATSLLFALAHAPTAWTLADPVAGLNPLVPAAAFGCSIVWGLIAVRTGRLVPCLFAHGFFSWAIVEFPVWRP